MGAVQAWGEKETHSAVGAGDPGQLDHRGSAALLVLGGYPQPRPVSEVELGDRGLRVVEDPVDGYPLTPVTTECRLEGGTEVGHPSRRLATQLEIVDPPIVSHPSA